MGTPLSEVSWDILESALRGIFHSIILDRQIKEVFSTILISVVVIAIILFIYRKMEKAPVKSGLSVMYDILGSLKFLILAGVILVSYSNASNNLADISSYKSRVEDALKFEETAIEKSVPLLREEQLSLYTDYSQPNVINDLFFLDKEYYTMYDGENDVKYYVVVLINEENIAAILDDYIKYANADLSIYRKQITYSEYNDLLQLG